MRQQRPKKNTNRRLPNLGSARRPIDAIATALLLGQLLHKLREDNFEDPIFQSLFRARSVPLTGVGFGSLQHATFPVVRDLKRSGSIQKDATR